MTTYHGNDGGRPAWSPDGQLIAFVRDGIWLIPAGGGARRDTAPQPVQRPAHDHIKPTPPGILQQPVEGRPLGMLVSIHE